MAFCKNCGNELKDGAKYCGNCGTPIDQPVSVSRSGNADSSQSKDEGQLPTGELLLQLEPKFVPVVKIVPLLVPLTMFVLFFGTFFYIVNTGSGDPMPTFVYIFIGAFALLWIGMPIGQIYFQKRTYDETEYKIYDDRVEYAEGFFNVQNNRVRLNRVIDVHYKQSVPQKWYNLGTITLDLSGGGSRHAIKFKDITDPEKIYEKIDELIARNM